MTVPEIFDRHLRRLRRDRAAEGFSDHSFLFDHIVDELIERLDSVKRAFTRALDIGCHDGRLTRVLAARNIEVVSADAGFRFARANDGVQCDEDRLPFVDGSFDLIVSAGVLDQVNDLPGALTLVKRILKPDGLFLAGFVGAGSIPQLRQATITADMACGSAVGSRMHPLIDVRAAGDLLGRAGFALPVADGEQLMVRYSNPLRILADLRGMAMTNILRERSANAYGAARLHALAEQLAVQVGEDGAFHETFALIFMTAWAPGPNQPLPARRGSGSASLADVLKQPR